ncbi:MAG: hypothetical protein ABFQ65_02930 [Nanoarchaeota archaeon]
MVKKLGRNKIEVIDSVPYSQIIFLVAKGFNYPQAVALKRNTEVSPTSRQMLRLKNQGYLLSLNEIENKNFLQNKKYFLINGPKINEDFINYIKSKNCNPDFKIPPKFIENKFLSLYFKKIFAETSISKYKTIKEIFEMFSRSLLDSCASISIEPKELSEFGEFLKIINPSNWEDNLFIDESIKIVEDFDESSIDQLSK